jgi:hypothetical protein
MFLLGIIGLVVGSILATLTLTWLLFNEHDD